MRRVFFAATAALIAAAQPAAAVDIAFWLEGPCTTDDWPAQSRITDEGVVVYNDFGCEIATPWREERGQMIATVSNCVVLDPSAPENEEWKPTGDSEVRYFQAEDGSYRIVFDVTGEIKAWPCQ